MGARAMFLKSLVNVSRVQRGSSRVVVLAEEPPGGATTFSDSTLDLLGVGYVVTVAPETVGYASDGNGWTQDELDEAVDEVVDGLLAMSPTTLLFGKDSFYGMLDADLDTALDRLQGGLTEIALTDDAREGVTAFVEKRPPRGQGR